jgi:hypothetical protein
VDRIDELMMTISKILDTLEDRLPDERRSNALKGYIECCRRFCTGRVIPDYPYWYVRLRQQADGIPSTPDLKGSRDIAQAITTLIGDVSYGATEAEHIQQSERILQLLQTMNI